MITNAHIYIMRRGDRLKVGCSKRPVERAKEVHAELLHVTPMQPQAERVEKIVHRLLRLAGKHHHGEWFNADIDETLSAIERALAIHEGRELPLDAIPRKKPTPLVVLHLPQWMLDKIDAIIEHERHGQGDRATVIREAIAAYVEK
jgi:hypothetical protein